MCVWSYAHARALQAQERMISEDLFVRKSNTPINGNDENYELLLLLLVFRSVDGIDVVVLDAHQLCHMNDIVKIHIY